jgi:hypothetical protein
VADDLPIYILDQITSKPGQGLALHRHYMETYAPAAQARGMTLEHCLVNPPLWLDGEQSNTLVMIWSVKGLKGFWGAAATPAAMEGATAQWWRDADAMIASRTRSVFGEASDCEVASV